MSKLSHNLKIAWRNLLKYKLQTSISILSLTVGMVCFALSALWLRYENSYDTWWPEHDDVYLLEYSDGSGYNMENGFSYYMPYIHGKRLAENNPEIELMARLQASGEIKMSEGAEPIPNCMGLEIDDNAQEMMGIKMLEGRKQLKLRKDEVVLTPSLAERLFPGQNAIGKSLWCNSFWGRSSYYITVVGIVEEPHLPSSFPYDFIKGVDEEACSSMSLHGTATFVRVRPENVETLAKKLETEVAQMNNYTEYDLDTGEAVTLDLGDFTFHYKMIPLGEVRERTSFMNKVVEENHLRLFVMLGIIVISCALFNYFTMLVTRIRIRQRELALRYVNGATMGNLITLFATELLLILVITMALATAVVGLTIDNFTAVCCINQPLSFFIGWFLLFALGAALCSLFMAAVIVYYTTRRQLHHTLDKHKQPQGRTPFGGGRCGLMVLQLAVGICAVFCSSMMMHQVRFLLTSPEMGFVKHNTGVINFSYPRIEDTEHDICSYIKVLEDDLRTWPEIEDYIVNYAYPIPNGYQSTFDVQVDGEDETMQFIGVRSDEHHFRFMDFQLVEGEFITSADDPTLVCITECAAKKLGKEGRIGGKFTLSSYGDFPVCVVKGIVKDLSYASPLNPVQPIVFTQNRDDMAYSYWIRIPIRWKEGTDWGELKKKAEACKERLFGDEPAHVWLDMAEEEYEKYIQSERVLCRLLCLVTIVCVLIAIFGIFSMVSLACERRRKEIAIRKVHGAKTGIIISMFLKEYLYMLLASAAIAFPVGYYLMHLWLMQYAKQAPVYWWIYPAILLAMLALIFLTVIWQIRKAARENPADVIKSE